jgi:hypothetical protein
MHNIDLVILSHLRTHGVSSPKVIAFNLRSSDAYTRQRVAALLRSRLVKKVGRGLYAVNEENSGRFLREDELRRALLIGMERYEPHERVAVAMQLGLLNPSNPLYGRKHSR